MGISRVIPEEEHGRPLLTLPQVDGEAARRLDPGRELQGLLPAAGDPEPVMEGLHFSIGRVRAGGPLLQTE
jgi:hypothetical protein